MTGDIHRAAVALDFQTAYSRHSGMRRKAQTSDAQLRT
jgi:hypothetical protein